MYQRSKNHLPLLPILVACKILSSMAKQKSKSGKLKIGDDWNAITIIALSQSNPLKAIAEFVENSIDAKAKNITIIRGKERGNYYLKIKDDGQGIPLDKEGIPNFKYVATHICDSIKRQLKSGGVTGLQGEFGIGLLSFWTLGEEMTMTSTGADGKSYQMKMKKGHPSFEISRKSVLFSGNGTELLVSKILPGIKQFSGEKIQWYLSSELRDRIRLSGVKVQIIDRTARATYDVVPRQFDGRLLHHLNKENDLYLEIYLSSYAPGNSVGLYRHGTRVLENISELDQFKKSPWNSGYIQGVIDAPFLNLTPGTRLGIIHDDGLELLERHLSSIETELQEIIEDQKRAEEERASRDVLKKVQSALKEALLSLPMEEYDWFNIHSTQEKPSGRNRLTANTENSELLAPDDSPKESERQISFFDFAGPLFSVRISPASRVIKVNGTRSFRAIARDRNRKVVDRDITFSWSITEGLGSLSSSENEIITFTAPDEPGLTCLELTAKQDDIICSAKSLITVTDSLVPETASDNDKGKGIPGYTFQKAPGELWRSRFDQEQNLIVINNGHRDFVFAARNKALKLRYISRLYAKELVLNNFLGISSDQLLERMIELTLYIEENLK